MPRTPIDKRRQFLLVGEDGARMDVVAKFAAHDKFSAPYFSVTSQRGSNHEDMISVHPELETAVKMHLSDYDGVPMHGLANLVFHLKEQDFPAAHRHVRGAASVDDLILVAGRAGMERTRVVAESEKKLIDAKRGLDGDLAKQAANLKSAKMDSTFFGEQNAKKEIARIEALIAPMATEKQIKRAAAREGDIAYSGVVEAFLKEKLAPIWKESAQAALAFLDGPSFRADGYVDRKDDPTTYEGFAAHHGLTLEVGARKSIGHDRFEYPCKLVSAKNSYSFPFTMGPDGEPELPRVLECLQSDVRGAEEPYDQWVREMGYDEDSRSAEKIYNACKKSRLSLLDVMGADTFDAFVNTVGEDEPINGRPVEFSGPKL